MKMPKSPQFDEIKELFGLGDDKVERYKNFYRSLYKHDTTLSDDDIINMVADAQDDYDPNDWAKKMKEIEEAPVPA